MAASLRQLVSLGRHTTCIAPALRRWRKDVAVTTKRMLLSESYSCNEAWKRHCEDPNLSQVSLNEFGYQVKDQLERTGNVSAVDMNVLLHHLNNMDDDEADFAEDLLARFNMCQSSIPRSDSTAHAVVRGFLSKHQDGASRLVRMLSERLIYGLFPDHYSLNLLLDRLIESQDWEGAARVAYHTMQQEELGDHAAHTWLCLHAVTQRLLQGPASDLALPQPQPTDEEQEEDWIKVKYIKFPVYDDHFDIKDERFLLGKTLCMLSQAAILNLPEELCTTLNVIGSGLHHKFPQGLAILEMLVASPAGTVSQQALEQFSYSLENVEARDPEEPEVELAVRTVDDVIHRLLPTTTEKSEYQTQLGRLREMLVSQGKVQSDADLGQEVSRLVHSALPGLEAADVEAQQEKFESWQKERQTNLSEQVEELRKAERMEEMKAQVKQLQEQEELLSYFDFEDKISLTFKEDDLIKSENLTISK